MAIDSVTSSVSAYLSATTQPATQTNQARQGQQAQQGQQTQQSQAVESKPRPEERVERKEEPPPRPVVNVNGQKTGTLISVTA